MQLEPQSFQSLAGWAEDDLAGFWPAFHASSVAIAESHAVLRPGLRPSPLHIALSRQVMALGCQVSLADAQQFLQQSFVPYFVQSPDGFLTGYYEPVVHGSLTESREFTAPLLSRPHDLIDQHNVPLENYPHVTAGRLGDHGLEPYPDRAAIEAGQHGGQTQPVVWLTDHTEVFLIQVQGSARVILPDGQSLRLIYDGRNGWPYSSIGRKLIERGQIAPDTMSLARLKQWLRANGQRPGEAGRNLMQENRSYVFFRVEPLAEPASGPVGGHGVPLTPLRSLAIDRSLWSYGLPFFVSADLGDDTPFQRLLVGQDTGSAIVGAARGDLYCGSGDDAGTCAGNIRHAAHFTVLLPRGAA